MSGDLNRLYAWTTSVARGMGEETFTDPDDDWAPVAFGATKKNERVFIQIDPDFMSGDEAKDQFVTKLVGVIREHRLRMLAMLMSTYVVKIPKSEAPHPEGKWPRPSLHPDREEMLMVCAIDVNRVISGLAPIHRSPDAPPGLGEFEIADDTMGRFVEPFRDALKIARRG